MSLKPFESYLQYVDQVSSLEEDFPSAFNIEELYSVLVSHGVVLLYARMEQSFQSAIERKCNRCPDTEVRTFA